MKEEQSPSENLGSNPEKSFSVAIEQMAQFLRTQVKLKERATRVLSVSSLPASFKNCIEQIAKLLRSEIQNVKTPKKHSWKRHPSKRKKT